MAAGWLRGSLRKVWQKESAIDGLTASVMPFKGRKRTFTDEDVGNSDRNKTGNYGAIWTSPLSLSA